MKRLLALGAVLVGVGFAATFHPAGRAVSDSVLARFRPAPDPVAVEAVRPSVTVADATRRTFRDQLYVSGTLVAREEALVGVQIDGLRIADVLAEDGDRVQAGQVLARLDRSQLDALAIGNDASIARADAAIAQAQAQIVQSEATLTQATADYERGRQLGTGVLSQSLLDQRLALSKTSAAGLDGAKSALAVARAERKSQDAQRRELDVRIGRTEVRSPVAGTVSRRSARVGALAMGSAEPLFRIAQDGALDLDAEVPDESMGRVTIGLPAELRLGADDAVVTGRVRLVASEVDRATRLGRVRLALPPGAPGRIGAFASAVVTLTAREGVAIPASAVTRGERGRVVQVVKNDVVEVRRVETGLAFRDLVEVTDGLGEGEVVVARAAAFLRGGDLVRPIRPAATASLR